MNVCKLNVTVMYLYYNVKRYGELSLLVLEEHL
jgi:hypothetical protein